MSDHSVSCDRAIAYLKAEMDDLDDGDVVELGEDSPVLRPLGGGLLVSYVVDQGDHFQFITNRHLAAEGYTADQIQEVGLANLAEAVDALEVRVHRSRSIFAVIAGGNYEASLLLLDDFWEHGFRQFVAGTYAAVVPAREIVAFADAGDSVALAQLREVVARVWPDGDHLLSQRLFARTDGAWKVFAN